MANRQDINDMYSGIKNRRGLIRQLFPFLRTDKDAEDMMKYLEASIAQRAEVVHDEENSIIKKYNKYKLSGLSVDLFGKNFTLKSGELQKAIKMRSKVTESEINKQNRFFKHFLDTNKQRIKSLQVTQAEINTHINQAKKELLDLKKAGGSKAEQKKALENIKKIKALRDKEINSRLAGYGVSGYENEIKERQKAIKNATKFGASKQVIDDLNNKLKVSQTKHESVLNGNKRYDFTLKNSIPMFKSSLSAIAENPMEAALALRGAFGILARSVGLNPTTAAIIFGWATYKEFIAPVLFGNNKIAGRFNPGSIVNAKNLNTGKDERIILQSKFKNDTFKDLLNRGTNRLSSLDFDIREVVGKHVPKVIDKIFHISPDMSKAENASVQALVNKDYSEDKAKDIIRYTRRSGIKPTVVAGIFGSENEGGKTTRGLGKGEKTAYGMPQVTGENIVAITMRKDPNNPFYIPGGEKAVPRDKRIAITAAKLENSVGSEKNRYNAEIFNEWLNINPNAKKALQKGNIREFYRIYKGKGSYDKALDKPTSELINKSVGIYSRAELAAGNNSSEIIQQNGQSYLVDSTSKEKDRLKEAKPERSINVWTGQEAKELTAVLSPQTPAPIDKNKTNEHK